MRCSTTGNIRNADITLAILHEASQVGRHLFCQLFRWDQNQGPRDLPVLILGSNALYSDSQTQAFALLSIDDWGTARDQNTVFEQSI